MKKLKIPIILIIFLLIVVIAAIIALFYFNKANKVDKSENNVNNKDNEVINENIENEVKENETTEDNNNELSFEEYPENIDEEVLKGYYGIEEDSNAEDSVAFNLAKKTIYSLIKNEEENKQYFDFYDILGIGDFTSIIEKDSNYARYCYPNNENNNLSAKYEDKIKYSIALFNENYYDGYYDIKTSAKNQYEALSKENKNESYYYEIPKILIMNGNNESEEEFKNNSRAKKIKITVNDDKEYTFNLEDTNKVQVFDLDYKQENIEKPVEIEVEVLESYPGEKTNDIYISDFQCSITSNIPQGR